MKEQKVITQEEAIEFLKKYTDDEVYTHKCITSHNMAISALEKQMTMKPVFVHPLQFDNWIPCSERLPEEEKDYLCCYEYTEIGGTHEGEKFKDYGVFYHDGYKWIKYWETINKKNIQVVAWQPLPEPYREEQEDE